MTTLFDRVRTVYIENPTISNPELYELFPNHTQASCRSAKSRVLKACGGLNLVHPFDKFVSKGAFPPYPTLLGWQKDLFDKCEENDITLILAPRGHGKSIFLQWYIEYTIEVKKMDILLLGWTDQSKRDAEHVHQYFMNKELLGAVKSEYHWKTKDNIRFDCYGVRGKDTRGFHPEDYGVKRGLVMVIDDALDDSYINEPSKEAFLERRYSMNLENISPDRVIITGTRLFEGDFYDFLGGMYGDDMYKYIRTPYFEDGLLAPEIWTVDRLEEKRHRIGEYAWHSEYMQNPHPVEGGVLDLTPENYVFTSDGKSAYEWAAISVDPARTVKKTSDKSAIITILKKRSELEYLVISTIIEKLEFEDLLSKIEGVFESLQRAYLDIGIIVPIETNGGGELIISSAKSRGFKFSGYIKPVHTSKDKKIKITSALEVPIKDNTMKFLHTLQEGELIKEIKQFPNCRYFDGIDSLAMGKMELEKKHTSSDVWDKWKFN